ncbi:unnamed protein product [Aphanomyces euteiches]|uniref:Uncharacterized protein n=1 Tax=Aphanomyces euteiches TaxID=100861 RepID=A0A6G0WB22_9STRA|nr:hypothetical protein Ae201684_016850 [Aphanomyces euteiches]KAH9076381.1 hypothetical protein Ae201684P_010327 [Aphanomyces euteiches]
MPPRLLATDLMERIGAYLPDYNALVQYLEAFQDDGALESMQVFRHLPDTIDKNDVWPELHIRDVGHLPALAPLAPHFTEVHIHDIYDLDVVGRILSPHNQLHVHGSPNDEAPPPNESLEQWFSRLARLPVVHCDIQELDIAPFVYVLPSIQSLRSLEISYARVDSGEKLFESIATSKLTRLSVSDIDLISGGKAKLTNSMLNHLSVWLSQQPVEELELLHWIIHANQTSVDHFYDTLWSCATLRELTFFDTKLPRLVVERCAQPIQLTYLNLGECDLRDANAVGLAQGLRHSKVETLQLKLNSFGRQGIEAIMSALTESSVSNLSFVCSNLSLASVQAIANHLGLTKLKVLNLYDNEVGAAGIESLMPAVVQSQLEQLNLALCNIDDQAARHLAEKLPSTHLTSLILDYNQITDDGAFSLAEAMVQTPKLAAIGLMENRLTEYGAGQFVERLEGRIPTKLNFADNDFSDTPEMMAFQVDLVEAAASEGHTVLLEDGHRDWWL